MNPARSKLWLAFWAGVVLVIAALSWASLTVYLLEERNAVSRAMNQRQEIIRLALWRMDSRLAPSIALEAARPIEDYDRVLGQPFDGFASSLDDRGAGVTELSKSDTLIEPQIDPGNYGQGFFEINNEVTKASDARVKEIADRAYGLPEALSDGASLDQAEEEQSPGAAGRVASSDVSVEIGAEEFSMIDSDGADSTPGSQEEGDYLARQQIANLAQFKRAKSKQAPPSDQDTDGDARRLEESGYAQTAWSELTNDPELNDEPSIVSGGKRTSSASSDRSISSMPGNQYDDQTQEQAVVGAIEPRWVPGDDGTQELVLVRTIERDGESVIQGVWLDWDSMSSELVGSIDDLLPTSTLEPILDGQNRPWGNAKASTPVYRLATIPVAFIPGGAVAVDGDSLTPAMLAMLVTWIAVIGAMIAVGLVLRTVLNLSARRGRFVGAVTHELRTPLTTFRLYSQMLADGMVTDETVRKDYLNTLKRESDRLTGIVENVLEYARLSRHGTVRSRATKDKPKGERRLTVGELMARIVPPMSRLGEQSGMDLIVSDATKDDAERTVTLDPHAIERIVMNLMDNACKYAGAAAEKEEDPDLRVHLDASVERDALLLTVSDHGPGVPGRDRRKIFGEFVRGSSGTMRDRSGLGLGLALSRGLALEMGGDLSLVRKRGHGAEFELRVPLDERSTD